MKPYIEPYMRRDHISFGAPTPEKKRETEYALIALLVGLMVIAFHYIVEPHLPGLGTPTAQAAEIPTKQLSDREQETLYCHQWQAGKPVLTATSTAPYLAVANHCKKYL